MPGTKSAYIDEVTRLAGRRPNAYWARRLLELKAYDTAERGAQLLGIVLKTDKRLLVEERSLLMSLDLASWPVAAVEQAIGRMDFGDLGLEVASAAMLWAQVSLPPTPHKQLALRRAAELFVEAVERGADGEAFVNTALRTFSEMPSAQTLEAGLLLLGRCDRVQTFFGAAELMPLAARLGREDVYIEVRSKYFAAAAEIGHGDASQDVMIANCDGLFALARGDEAELSAALDRLRKFSPNVPYLDRDETLMLVERLIEVRRSLPECRAFLENLSDTSRGPRTAELLRRASEDA